MMPALTGLARQKAKFINFQGFLQKIRLLTLDLSCVVSHNDVDVFHFTCAASHNDVDASHNDMDASHNDVVVFHFTCAAGHNHVVA